MLLYDSHSCSDQDCENQSPLFGCELRRRSVVLPRTAQAPGDVPDPTLAERESADRAAQLLVNISFREEGEL